VSLELCEIIGDKLRLNFHVGQWQAWQSEKRITLMLAGSQGGKTAFGPHWLLREVQRCGQGDYLVVTPTFPLLDLKALPSFLWLFSTVLDLGRYTATPSRKFTFSPEGERRLFEAYDPYKSTRVIFGYATEPESLESATALAAWLDEAGQRRFKLGSWEAILRRLALARGRALITTTPYCANWVQSLHDKARAGDQNVALVQYESILNPAFSTEEFGERARDMPRWKFNMMYRGLFERPPGLIYDALKPLTHFVPRFAIPKEWRRWMGLDFGAVNMAAVCVAEDPETQRLYVYREYHQAGESVTGHVRRLLRGETLPLRAVGGAASEDGWRSEFKRAGLGVTRPRVGEVEVGIDRVYAALQTESLFVFDDLEELKEDLSTYSRKLDERGQPTDEIEDKETFHLADALRYVVSEMRGGGRVMQRMKVNLYGGQSLRTG